MAYSPMMGARNDMVLFPFLEIYTATKQSSNPLLGRRKNFNIIGTDARSRGSRSKLSDLLQTLVFSFLLLKNRDGCKAPRFALLLALRDAAMTKGLLIFCIISFKSSIVCLWSSRISAALSWRFGFVCYYSRSAVNVGESFC